MTTTHPKFKGLTIIYLFFLMAQVILAAVMYFLQTETYFDFDFKEDPRLIVATIGVLGGIGLVPFMYKKQLEGVLKQSGFPGKLGAYQGAQIVSYAITEGPALMCLVFFFISGNLYYLLMASILILYFVTRRPNQDRFIQEAQLTSDEKKQMHDSM